MCNAALMYLNNLNNSPSKLEKLEYKKISPQEYILSDMSDEQIQTLFALCGNMLRVKANFPRGYATPDEIFCTLGCATLDTQQHLLDCKYLIEELDDKSWQKLNTGIIMVF